MTDWTDPCARAEALRSAYYQLLTGASAVKVTIKANDTLQDTEFQKTDMNLLLQALREAEAECAANTPGSTPRRFAIRAGSRK